MNIITEILDKQIESLEWIEHNAGSDRFKSFILLSSQRSAEYIERRLLEMSIDSRS